jgi:hypothetical protein
LDPAIRAKLETALAVVDDHGTRGPRLQHDARRLWHRVRRLLALSLVSPTTDLDALELACLALHLPMKCPDPGPGPTRHLARPNLRDRAEAAADLLLTAARHTVPDSLLDRATRLLNELPQRQPVLDDAKLLADAVNLEDFGVAGLFNETLCLGVAGLGTDHLADGRAKRDQYGYWEARLKDGFHFEPVRQLARQRLERARHVTAMLRLELDEDTAPQ